MKAIKNRFSVSEFTDKKISKEDLIEILNCGILAPSVKNTQPWFMTILRQDSKQNFRDFFIKNFNKLIVPAETENSQNRTFSALKTADTVILVWNTSKNKWAGSEHSCCALMQNILTKATDLDIGSLWISDILLVKNEIKKYFKKDYSLVGAIALGYSKPQPKHRGRKSLEKVCEFL
ncbi:MAG: nitroreductase family protein [Alphaproteobacteria bacterium]|nr:MAG: hypothetical protein B6I23_00435 [Rickettsiaceae bacterium 4572_127]